jgi:hypothetical protein
MPASKRPRSPGSASTATRDAKCRTSATSVNNAVIDITCSDTSPELKQSLKLAGNEETKSEGKQVKDKNMKDTIDAMSGKLTLMDIFSMIKQKAISEERGQQLKVLVKDHEQQEEQKKKKAQEVKPPSAGGEGEGWEQHPANEAPSGALITVTFFRSSADPKVEARAAKKGYWISETEEV